MGKRKAQTKPSIPGISKDLLELVWSPNSDITALWRSLGAKKRREMLASFFDAAEGDFRDVVLQYAVQRLHGFRKKWLESKSTREIAAILERIPAESRFVRDVVFTWAREHEERLFWIFCFTIAVTEDEADDDGVVKFAHRMNVRLDRVEDAAARLLAAANPTDAIAVLFLVYHLEPAFRAPLEAVFARLTSGEYEALRLAGKASLAEDDPREYEEDWEDNDWEDRIDEDDLAADGRNDEDEADEASFGHVMTPGDGETALTELRSELADLVARMEEAAQAARTEERVPNRELLNALVAVRNRYMGLCFRVTALAQMDGVEVPPLPEVIETMTALPPILATWRDALASRHREEDARALLLRVLRLHGTGDEPLPSLRQWQNEASKLLETLEDEPDVVRALNDGTHPLARLLSALDRHDALDNREKTRLGAELSPIVGADLAFALLLGQVTESSELHNTAETTPAAASEVEPESEAELESEAEPEPQATQETKRAEEAEEASRPSADEVSHDQVPHAEVAEEASGETPQEEHPAEPVTAEVREELPSPALLHEGAEPAASATVLEPSPSVQERSDPVPAESEEEPALPAPGLSVVKDPREECAALSLDDLAYRMLESSSDERPIYGEEFAARLLLEDRRGLAVHVTRWTEQKLGSATRLPSSLLTAVTLAPRVSSPAGRLFTPVRNALGGCDFLGFGIGDDEWDQGLALLLAAATLRPSLLAPNTLAPHILGRVKFKDGLRELWDYCQFVARHTRAGHAIDPSVLKRVKDQAAWEREMADLRDRTEEWQARAPRATMVFAAATMVWQVWQRKGEVIAELLRPIRENDPSRRSWLEAEIERLSDPSELRRLVDETDKKEVGRTKGRPIIAKAYNQIQTKLGEALDLAREWLALLDVQPGQKLTYRIEQANQIRREATGRHPQIRAELEVVEAGTQSTIVRAGIFAVRRALADIEEVFSTTSDFSREEPEPGRLLNAPLLRVAGINLDPEWELIQDDPERVAAAIARTRLDSGFPNWPDAYQQRSDAGDHVGTELILQILEEDGVDSSDLRKRRHRAIAEAREQVRRQAADVQQQVEQAVMHGLLREADRARLIDRVTRVEAKLPDALAFDLLRAELTEVAGAVERCRAEQVAAVRERIERAGVAEGSKEYDRVMEVLDQGDVLTANEFLHHIESGLALPPKEEPEDESFDAFFPMAVRALESWRMPNSAQVVRMVRARNALPATDLAAIPEAQAELAADMLQRWYRARGIRGRADGEAVQSVFDFLGFNVLSISAAQAKEGSNRAWLTVETEAVRDRSRCPVAFFGSGAAGDFSSERARYRVLCVWGEPTPEDLIGFVGETAQEPPTIVLHFGRMGEARRRSLARLTREQRRTFLVLDEILLFYLMGETGSRMATFFACTLPFTYLEPYVTTAGVVPPEVFYGRETERQSVIEPYGSCFIYGGRQLGKTALLRHVERRFHDPVNERIALYIDLKSVGIAFDRPVDDVWQILAERMKDLGVLDASIPAHANPDKILDEIQRWLSAGAQRRILLLLDEADRFLEADKAFTRVARLKGLMDATNRRFKVVFAGLHNVQRSTRVSNNPLAHLGEPLCIGPLFENGEWRRARELIERPLRAIGYRFESPDLVTRILSQTNYYPSLLQLYGTQLLRHVNRPGVEVFDSRSGPPYEISTRAVEDAYQSKELWQRIRERFVWTLDLDPRYRLIALLIAYHSALDDEVAQNGLSVRDIRQYALDWWAAAFHDDHTEDTFRVLLDEMVGLGILRENDSGVFTLRSANVALLMGTQDEIEEGLVNLSDQDPPTAYEPATFRRQLPNESGTRESTRCSPLTVLQESELQVRENGISVVFGTEAAGLSDLYRLLPKIFGSEYFVHLDNATTRDAFRRQLGQLRARRGDGVTLVLVDSTTPWTPQWVESAAKKLATLRSKMRFVRIVFVADPARAWAVAETQPDGFGALQDAGLSVITLQPWHDAAVRAWLDELRVPATLLEQNLERLREHTGKWAGLLYEVERTLQATPVAKWEGAFNAFAESWQDADVARARAALFGLDAAPVQTVLRVLGAVGPAGARDLAAVSEVDVSRVHQVLRWASLLGLAHEDALEEWTLDRIVARTLDALS